MGATPFCGIPLKVYIDGVGILLSASKKHCSIGAGDLSSTVDVLRSVGRYGDSPKSGDDADDRVEEFSLVSAAVLLTAF